MMKTKMIRTVPYKIQFLKNCENDIVPFKKMKRYVPYLKECKFHYRNHNLTYFLFETKNNMIQCYKLI